jgi:hypothetical protein
LIIRGKGREREKKDEKGKREDQYELWSVYLLYWYWGKKGRAPVHALPKGPFKAGHNPDLPLRSPLSALGAL